MPEERLMKGNEAIAESAIRAGCRFYSGYPITPQSEILEYMAANLPKRGGIFIQSASEIEGINIVYGASSAGLRAMTSSSSPGISLMQEEISYLASAELPVVVVNITRGGPGLGRITPAQSDYFQATKGGGHGDYHLIVLAPASVQEMADLTVLAFDLADKYRIPVMILGDGTIGQLMENVTLADQIDGPSPSSKGWAVNNDPVRKRNLVLSAPFTDQELVELNEKLSKKYYIIKENETRWEEYQTENAQYLIVAFGISSRFAKAAIEELRKEGIKTGLIRPISLYPFPSEVISEKSANLKGVITVEMNEGQMVEDVKLAVYNKCPVHFLGRGGGELFTPDKIVEFVKNLSSKEY